jgi:hypothetical protein
MAFLDQEFELTRDNEMEEIIAELPIPLVLENIREQVADPLSSKVDNLETILEKYDYIMANYDDQDQLLLLKNKVANLLITVYNIISDKYDITFMIDEDNMEELRDVTQALYSVIILRYTKNITMYLFLLAYLEEVELRGKARTDLVRMGLEQVVGRQVLNQVEMVEIQAQAILRMAEMVALELVAEEVVVCHVKEEKEDRV